MSDKIREALEAWFGEQIADAKERQTEGFRRNQIAGERGHARHCALFEAKQAVLAALQATPSRPVTAGAQSPDTVERVAKAISDQRQKHRYGSVVTPWGDNAMAVSFAQEQREIARAAIEAMPDDAAVSPQEHSSHDR